jgi:hypothetical protein
MLLQHLELGGVQTNALDLATGLRQHSGHDVIFCAPPGPAGAPIRERGFRLIDLPLPKIAPSPTLSRLVFRLARNEQVDLVHAYDSQQIFDAFFGIHLLGRMPMLGTVMSMGVQRVLPRSIPMTYGTVELVERARQSQHAPVWLLEPPVNTDRERPGRACALREYINRQARDHPHRAARRSPARVRGR